jgi:acyl dehydratase
VPLNTALVGRVYETVSVAVDRERALRFADAVGEDGPLYRDPDAARAAGYPDQLVAPTFITAAEVLGVAQVLFDPELGLDFSRIVHAQQSYRFDRPICVGDVLDATPRISDIRSLGSNEVLVVEANVTDAAGRTVAVARGTMLSRGTAGGS